MALQRRGVWRPCRPSDVASWRIVTTHGAGWFKRKSQPAPRTSPGCAITITTMTAVEYPSQPPTDKGSQHSRSIKPDPGRRDKRPNLGTTPVRHHPRVSRSAATVISTTLDVIAETGLGPTLQELSDRSGVAKTTIYRIWPDRDAIVAEAIIELANRQEPPVLTGPVAARVERVVRFLASLLDSPQWSAVLAGLAVEARHGRPLGLLYGEVIAWFRRLLVEAIEPHANTASPSSTVIESLDAALAVLLHATIVQRPLEQRTIARAVDIATGQPCFGDAPGTRPPLTTGRSADAGAMDLVVWATCEASTNTAAPEAERRPSGD